MKNSYFLCILSILCSSVINLWGASNKNEGPYFGNGFRNGWADQHSIVLWTRLTMHPEMNRTGPQFLLPDEDAKKVGFWTDFEKIMKAQVPEGYTLDQLEGACPGMNGEVQLVWFAKEKPTEKSQTEWVAVNPAKDFTHQWKLTGLTPGTNYNVILYARPTGQSQVSDTIQGAFLTPLAEKSTDELRFCVVTCHDYPRRDDPQNGHKIYPAMLHFQPHFYVHTGDVEYYDRPYPYALTEELMRFQWNRYFALPFQREFFTQITSYFMKDDHDALCNDAYPGITYGLVSFDRGLDIFDKEQFPSNDKPYKTIRWGKDLQIWIIEGRNYRSPNNMEDSSEKTVLGKEQKEWLFSTLKESDATFKLLITPTPIVGPDRKQKKDNLANSIFKTEGDEVRSFLNQFDNLYICNGDRHWQYVSHPQGTNLWEFSCGPGSDMHAEGWPENEIYPEHRFLRVKGGFLQGLIKYDSDNDPNLYLQHCDVDGRIFHEESFKSNSK